MLGPWSLPHRTDQRAFHELDDGTDNWRTGRVEASLSSSSSSLPEHEASTPILPNVFTNFWNLTVPIMTRTQRSRYPKKTRRYGEDLDKSIDISQEWKEASRHLPSVLSVAQQAAAVVTDSETESTNEQELPHPSAKETPPRKFVLPVTTKVDNSVSPPFNAGYCSTIAPVTPETRVVTIPTASADSPDFCESPIPTQESPVATTSRVVQISKLAATQQNTPNRRPPPAQISPETVRSEHSNPPYIPPVQATPWPQGANTAQHLLYDSQTSGGIVRIAAQVSQIHNPPPLEFWIVPPSSTRRGGMDDVSSLGGDSIGETPTRIFIYTQQNGVKLESPTTEGTEPNSSARRSNENGTCSWCCWRCLPNRVRRVPRLVWIALFFGTSLLLVAAALVVLAVVLSRNNHGQESAISDDWTGSWTLPPASLPTEYEQDAPSASPAPAAAKLTPMPTVWEQVLVPADQFLDDDPAQGLSSQPSMYPSMAPSLYPSLSTPSTQFPTFAPRGMMRKRRNLSRSGKAY